MKRADIEKALVFWKTLLRLEDWRVDVFTGQPPHKMKLDKENLDGLNLFSPEELYSQIYLRRGATEEILVHELLHLVFDGDKADHIYDVLHERALNRTAEAFVKLKGATCKQNGTK